MTRLPVNLPPPKPPAQTSAWRALALFFGAMALTFLATMVVLDLLGG